MRYRNIFVPPLPTDGSPMPNHVLSTRLLRAQVTFREQPFARPLVLSSGTIDRITQADVRVEVEVDGRHRGVGNGCIYLSDLWAWPHPTLDHPARDAAMRAYASSLADTLPGILHRDGSAAHPLSLGLRLHEHALHQSDGPSPWPPALARMVSASPFDAAIHDAVGRAIGRNALDFYDADHPIPDADEALGGDARAMIRGVIQTPRRQSPAWLVVGFDEDPLVTLATAIARCGYFAFKVRLRGQTPADDAARTAAVYRAARAAGVVKPRLSVDANCAVADSDAVLDFIQVLRSIDGDAFDALETIEQPTARDIAAAPFDWHGVSRLKPVLVDEGLTSFATMRLAREQGWSGLALKTCKGHSFTLVAAAWAHANGMQFALQDLTNPGLAAVHAALLASRLPTVNGVELNSPQFTPAANAELSPIFPNLFSPKSGYHELPSSSLFGLGGSSITAGL
jgi:L-alanine-DL-glutamate epimerase-like enolase superfamily enzyme